LVKEEKRIAVFGEDVLWSKPFLLKNNNVHFFGLEEEDLDIFDPIVIVAGTISSRLSQEKQHAQVITRKKEINYALKKGAHVCILCHDPTDPLFQQILSDYGIQFIKSTRQQLIKLVHVERKIHLFNQKLITRSKIIKK
jgi:hypothetical protein